MSQPPNDRPQSPRQTESHAHLPSCTICGERMEVGVGGICQVCFIGDPVADLWKPREPPTMEELAEALPRYKIQKELGRGALGAVYGAIDQQLDRVVAIKAMWEQAGNPEYGARFASEAKAMAKLAHPNIVTIHDYGVDGELRYLVMERMEGGTLAQEISKNGPLSPDRAKAVFRDVCQALQHAHDKGVIHRDVKPSNILLDGRGRAKLSDFGLVRGVLPKEFEGVALTKTNMAVGTPYYMAPEQMEWPIEADHRADIYSAGVVYYEMVMGEPLKPRQERSSEFPDVPKSLEPIFDRALHEKPEQRYQSPNEFLKAVSLVSARNTRRFIWLGAVATLVLGIFVGALTYKAATKSKLIYRVEAPNEAIEGLPLGSLDKEIRLKEWTKRAEYEFEGDPDERARRQPSFQLVGGAVIEGDDLVLSKLQDAAQAELKRDSAKPIGGLALHFRFKPEAYLAVGKESMAIVYFGSHWTQGLFLVSSKWGDPNPTWMLSKYQPLAPPGVIEPKLDAGVWHEVWIVMSEGYQLWIDGEPVYRSNTDPQLVKWENWTVENPVTLRFEGFQGKVDFVRVWEKR